MDVHGLTYAAAAKVLDVPEGTVMSRLHRARKRVRDSLAGSGLARGGRDVDPAAVARLQAFGTQLLEDDPASEQA